MAENGDQKQLIELLDHTSELELSRAIGACQLTALHVLALLYRLCTDEYRGSTSSTVPSSRERQEQEEREEQESVTSTTNQELFHFPWTQLRQHAGYVSLRHHYVVRLQSTYLESSNSGPRERRFVSAWTFEKLESGNAIFPISISLTQCARIGSKNLVRLALDHGAYVHHKIPGTRDSALHIAAQYGHVAIMEILLDYGARGDDMDAGGRTPMHTASQHGQYGAVDFLMHRGFDVNKKGIMEKTALHWAAEYGHAQVIRLLVARGADMKIKMRESPHPTVACPGGGALHCAVEHGHESAVLALIELGALVNEVDRWDKITPLGLSVWKRKYDITDLLLKNGANPNGAEGTDTPPIVWASARGDLRTVQLLLVQKDIDLGATDADGDNAIHSAARNGHVAVVRLLLEHKVQVNIRGAGGRTPYWWAENHHHQEVMSALREHGGSNDGLPPDLVDDSALLLNWVANGDVAKHIGWAQDLMFGESEFLPWANKLRFIVAIGSNNNDGSYDLDLISGQSSLDTRYIAVSYCWSGRHGFHSKPPLRVRVPGMDQEGRPNIRIVRANTGVLWRAMHFASSRGISMIWIDQECIDQDNESDKQKAIQSMHMVYQRAEHTLVLLDCHVRSVDDIRALPNLLRYSGCEDLRDRILADKWFTRAWTTQEWTNTRPERLTYSIGWDDDLDIFGVEWRRTIEVHRNPGSSLRQQKTFRQWELGYGDVMDLSNMSTRFSSIWLDQSLAAYASGISHRTFTLVDAEDEEIKRIHKHSNSPQQTCLHKPLRMKMAAAYKILLKKRNLKVSDRLAILGNLAQYPYCLNTDDVVKSGLSFSACVIAIALYNGDMSVLFWNPDPWKDKAGMPTELTQVAGLPRWLSAGTGPQKNNLESLPLPGELMLADHRKCGDPCLVMDEKLLVRGILWNIAPFHGFADCKEEISRLIECARRVDLKDKALDAIGHKLGQTLVGQLLKLDRRDLLELLLVLSLPRQLSHPDEIGELLDGFEKWYRGQAPWPSWVKDGARPDPNGRQHGQPLLLYFESLPGSSAPPPILMPNHPWGNPMILYICDIISKGLPLAVGRCRMGGDDLVSLFTFDAAKHTLAFTPLSELEYEYGENSVLQGKPKRNFWVVKFSDQCPGVELLQRAGEKLKSFDLHHGESLSECFEAQKLEPYPLGVWSPRLCRLGLLKLSERGLWETLPLGKAAKFAWFS